MNYSEIIEKAAENGGLLDCALACQKAEGFVSEAAIYAMGGRFNKSAAEIFDALSFYSMLHFEPKGHVHIEICRGAPCHVAGSDAVIAAVEKTIGASIGSTTADGKYTFEYTECQGQCQAAPSLLVNGKLYTDMTPEKVTALLKGGLDA